MIEIILCYIRLYYIMFTINKLINDLFIEINEINVNNVYDYL